MKTEYNGLTITGTPEPMDEGGRVMADLISRRAAIDAIHEDADWLAAQGSDWQMERMERDKSILRSLPSAQPLDPCETCLHKGKGWDEEPCDGCTGTESGYEPDNGWIPVSERSPEEGQMCLVCDRGAIGIDTYIGHGNPYNWKWYMRDYDAWMPLPDPYGGEE